MTKKLSSLVALLAMVIAVAGGTAWLSVALHSKFRKADWQHAHDWIHTQLALSAEQERALVPIEKRYREKRRDLEERLQMANTELAEAIVTDGRDSKRVQETIEKIHLAMGDLQKLTIGHVFEMQGVLTPVQYKRLLNLTANALHNLDTGHARQ